MALYEIIGWSTGARFECDRCFDHNMKDYARPVFIDHDRPFTCAKCKSRFEATAPFERGQGVRLPKSGIPAEVKEITDRYSDLLDKKALSELSAEEAEEFERLNRKLRRLEGDPACGMLANKLLTLTVEAEKHARERRERPKTPNRGSRHRPGHHGPDRFN